MIEKVLTSIIKLADPLIFTVEALFNAQEKRASANATKERWFGFGLGIIASLVASFLIIIAKYFFNTLGSINSKRKNQ